VLLAGIAAAGVLGITFLFGRWYCSLLCPLGLLQDLFLLLTGRVRRRKQRPGRPLRGLHFGTAVLTLGAAAAGVPLLLNLLEPYALWGRILRDLTIPVVAATTLGLSELLKEVSVFIAPVAWSGDAFVALVTGFFWLILFLLVWFRGRWFCNALCPAGALLRLPSAVSLFALKVRDERCISCGSCGRSCKAGCISSRAGVYRIDSSRCVSCLDCAAVCPTGAIGIERRAFAFGSRSGVSNDGRRRALGRLAGMGGGTMALGFLPMPLLKPVWRKRETAPDGSENLPATPPGSEGIRRFSSRCIACHTCVSVCPTRVLQPAMFEYGYGGFMQPVMDYKKGYCEWECADCTRVCPTDAIRPLTLERKQEIQIGEVQFLRDRCVIFSEGTACGACAEVCPTQAVYMVPYVAGLTQPAFEKKLCVGCGNCEYACPVEGGKAIYVRGKRVHTIREVREKQQDGPVEAEPEEFPF
jgi:ferredoxin